MKISEFKNEDAIDLLADLIDPVSSILGDEEIKKAFQANASKMQIAKMCLKNHKQEALEILAKMDGKEVEEYSCNPITIIKDLIILLNDKELVDFFSEQQAQGTTGE